MSHLISFYQAFIKVNMQKAKILILSFSHIQKDPRILKQIAFLKEEYFLSAVGYGEYQDPSIKFYSIPMPKKTPIQKAAAATYLLSGFFEHYYWDLPQVQAMLELGRKLDFDIILANDIDTLPLARKIAGPKPVVFDAHEYFPSEFDESLKWRVFYKRYKKYLCKRYVTRLPYMMTVSHGIAKAYKEHYHVEPHVVTNACFYHDIHPRPTPQGGIRIIYHGGVHPSRQIENIIKLANYLDKRFILELILQPSAGYEDYYDKIQQLASRSSNIILSTPVPVQEIVTRISQADIGLHILPATSFNNDYALPNRFAEFIQARLAIAVGPSAEMGTLVQRHGCGIVAADFSAQSMGKTLNALTTTQIDIFKKASHSYATVYCAEYNRNIVQNIMLSVK